MKIQIIIVAFLMSASISQAAWYAKGNFNSWSLEAMTETTPGLFLLTHSFGSPDANGWKVDNGAGTEKPGGFGADSWYQVPSGSVDFIFDVNTYNDGWLPRTELFYTNPVRVNSTYYIVGDFQGWDSGAGYLLKDDGTETGDVSGDNIFIKNSVLASKGMHYWKVILDSGSWNRQITSKSACNTGVSGNDFAFFTMQNNDSVRFFCDVATNRLKVEPVTVGYTIYGTFNSWNMADGISTSTTPGIYTLTHHFDDPTSGNWKITKNNGYDTYPGPGYGQDSWYEVTAAGDVVFSINTNSQGDGWLPDANFFYTTPAFKASQYTAVGDWQDKAGDSANWKVDSTVTVMNDDGSQDGDVANDGIYVLYTGISTPGTYVYKVILNGTWDRQIRADGANGSGFDVNDKISFTTVASNQKVRFLCDINANRIKVEVQAPNSGVPDWMMIH